MDFVHFQFPQLLDGYIVSVVVEGHLACFFADLHIVWHCSVDLAFVFFDVFLDVLRTCALPAVTDGSAIEQAEHVLAFKRQPVATEHHLEVVLGTLVEAPLAVVVIKLSAVLH